MLSRKLFISTICIAAVYALACAGLFALNRHSDLDGNAAYAYPIHGQDSPEFAALGHNLVVLHRFTLDGAIPETFRTPGYPFLLAVSEAVFGTQSAAVGFQILMVIGIFLMMYKIAKQLLPEGVALLAALFFVLGPSTIFHTLVLLSEIPFIFFFLFATYMIFFGAKDKSRIFLGGVTLGIATLIRPISLYLVPIYALCLIYKYWGGDWKRHLGVAAIFTVGALLIIMPWSIRNRIEAGGWGLSSVSAYNLARYNVRDYMLDTYGADSVQFKEYDAAISSIPTPYARTLEGSAKLQAIAMPVLKAHLLSYAAFHIVTTAKFFLSSNLRYVGNQLAVPKLQRWLGLSSDAPDLLSELKTGHVAAVGRTLLQQLPVTIDRAITILIMLLACMGAYVERKRFGTLLSAGIILYFAILTGPVSIPRYRLPVEPFVVMLAFTALYQLLRRYRGAIAFSRYQT